MDIFHEAFRSFNLRFSYKSPRQKSHLLKLENPAVMPAVCVVVCCLLHLSPEFHIHRLSLNKVLQSTHLVVLRFETLLVY